MKRAQEWISRADLNIREGSDEVFQKLKEIRD